jgi:hypothetical protein
MFKPSRFRRGAEGALGLTISAVSDSMKLNLWSLVAAVQQQQRAAVSLLHAAG